MNNILKIVIEIHNVLIIVFLKLKKEIDNYYNRNDEALCKRFIH